MQEQLRQLWNSLATTVNIHPEDSNTQARYVENNVWMIVDELDGFHLITDNEVAGLFSGYSLEP